MILVGWSDTGVVHGWRCNEDASKDGFANCQSVGILVAETEDKITITLGISDQGLVLDCMTIPKGCIKSIKELRLK